MLENVIISSVRFAFPPNFQNLATLLGTPGIEVSDTLSPNTRKAMTTGRLGHTLTRGGFEWPTTETPVCHHAQARNGV